MGYLSMTWLSCLLSSGASESQCQSSSIVLYNITCIILISTINNTIITLQSFLLAGDACEELSVGLGQSVEDSFGGLVYVISKIEDVVDFMLVTQFARAKTISTAASSVSVEGGAGERDKDNGHNDGGRSGNEHDLDNNNGKNDGNTEPDSATEREERRVGEGGDLSANPTAPITQEKAKKTRVAASLISNFLLSFVSTPFAAPTNGKVLSSSGAESDSSTGSTVEGGGHLDRNQDTGGGAIAAEREASTRNRGVDFHKSVRSNSTVFESESSRNALLDVFHDETFNKGMGVRAISAAALQSSAGRDLSALADDISRYSGDLVGASIDPVDVFGTESGWSLLPQIFVSAQEASFSSASERTSYGQEKLKSWYMFDSLTFHFAIVCAVLVMVSSFQYEKHSRRVLYMLLSSIFCIAYMQFISHELQERQRVQVGVKSVADFLRRQVQEASLGRQPIHSVHSTGSTAGGMEDNEKQGQGYYEIESDPQLRMNDKGRFETSVWYNVFFSTLWSPPSMLSASTKDIPLVGTGGMGEYMSESMERVIKYELAQLPQGASNFALKRFSLGKKPPLVKAIRVTSRREDVCLPSNYHYSSTNNSQTKEGKGGDCVHLILDFDFVYASRDMDIVFTLRSEDIKSMLPEAQVKLSEVLMSGLMRVDMEITDDYPFIGTATVSFLAPPSLDATIELGHGVTGFGLSSGIDVNSIPGVWRFLNSTMTTMLAQYTEPIPSSSRAKTQVDLRHTICPYCDNYDGSQSPDEHGPNLEKSLKLNLGPFGTYYFSPQSKKLVAEEIVSGKSSKGGEFSEGQGPTKMVKEVNIMNEKDAAEHLGNLLNDAVGNIQGTSSSIFKDFRRIFSVRKEGEEGDDESKSIKGEGEGEEERTKGNLSDSSDKQKPPVDADEFIPETLEL